VSEGIFTHVSKRWVCNGTQINNGDTFRENFIPNGSCSSHKSRSKGQSDRKLDAISNEQGTQKIRITRAKITPIEYNGKMWCVEVPTGAFVARRNGKIFITGNSGFPKGINIEKAINKMEKVEFEEQPASGVGFMNPEGVGGYNVTQHQLIQKGESTENAKKWTGWNTTLKPAWEPIVLARKPLGEKTVALNVLKYGTGAINKDGCRIGDEIRYNSTAGNKSGTVYSLGINNKGKDSPPTKSIGRWPSNVIHDGSDEVISLFPESKSGKAREADENVKGKFKGSKGWGNIGIGHCGAQYGDSGSTARFFSQTTMEDSEWLALNLNLFDALIAEKDLYLLKVLDAIVLKVVAISVLPVGTALNVVRAPSMIVTAKESKNLAEMIIKTMKNLSPKLLLDWKQEDISQNNSPAKIVAIREPTGTMTITINHWKSDGFVDPVILNITPESLELGEKACRFKYCAKASNQDRDEGIPDDFERTVAGVGALRDGDRLGYDLIEDCSDEIKIQIESFLGTTVNKITKKQYETLSEEHKTFFEKEECATKKNFHSTVKPTKLMRWLCRLVTPPNGTVLDPFMGSGSTGKAAILEGFNFIGVERELDYFRIAEARIKAVMPKEPEVIREIPLVKTEQMNLGI